MSRGEVPSYLFASNANPMVVIISNSNIEENYLEIENIDYKDSDLEIGTYKSVIKILTTELKRININAIGFIHMNLEKAKKTEYSSKINKELHENGAQYIISFNIGEWDDLKKLNEKGKLDVDHLKATSMTISEPLSTDINKMLVYFTLSNTLVSNFIDKLNSDALKLPKTYFVTEMKVTEYTEEMATDLKNYEQNISEKKFKIIENLPVESLLKNETLSIFSLLKKERKSYAKLIEKCKKSYPYKFELSSAYYNPNTKLSLLYFTTPQNYTVTKPNGYKSERTEYRTGNAYYFGIYDKSNNIVYFPETEKRMKAHANLNYYIGLNVYLKELKKHYKWNIKN